MTTQKKPLTNKQEAFVREYLVDKNAAAAARRAGYSERTANRIGTENLSKPVIAEAIQKGLDKQNEKAGISAEQILNDIKEIAQAMKTAAIKYQDSKCANAANNSLKLLGQNQKLFTEKVEHSGEVGVSVTINRVVRKTREK